MNKIIFNVPQIVGNELKNQNSLKKYKKFSSNGYYTNKCRSWLIKNIKCEDALLVKSCTAALEMCALLIDIKPGDSYVNDGGAVNLLGGDSLKKRTTYSFSLD